MSVFKKFQQSRAGQAGKVDYVFLGLTAAIVVLGLVFLTSASSVIAFQKWGDSYHLIKRQLLFGLLPGFVLAFVLARVPYERLRRLALPALVCSFALLVLVFLPGLGASYGGARRWLRLGAFLLQPAELVKLGFLVYLAAWLERLGPEVRSFTRGFVPFVLTLGAVLSLIVLQPDIGTMTVVAVSSVVVFFVAGSRASHLALFALGGGALLWLVLTFAPYRAQRLTVFLHPELDPQGIGYHVNQALLAVGSGGWFGVGLGYSRQKYAYLPEVTSDSVFAIMAEEIGFVFTFGFLVLVAAFLFRGFRIAARAPDPFGRYLATGIVVWLGWQTCINVASMLSLLPLTGVPLPFVSAGGTALATSLAGIGILLSISRVGRSAS